MANTKAKIVNASPDIEQVQKEKKPFTLR